MVKARGYTVQRTEPIGFYEPPTYPLDVDASGNRKGIFIEFEETQKKRGIRGGITIAIDVVPSLIENCVNDLVTQVKEPEDRVKELLNWNIFLHGVIDVACDLLHEAAIKSGSTYVDDSGLQKAVGSVNDAREMIELAYSRKWTE